MRWLLRAVAVVLALFGAAHGCDDSESAGVGGAAGTGGTSATTTTQTTSSGAGGEERVDGCWDIKLFGCDGTKLLACDGHYHTVVVGDCADRDEICLDHEDTYLRLLGCFECDPLAYEASCDGSTATYCGWHGSIVTETCLNECSNGRCCHPDADGDGVRDCDGDCDDADPDAHPGQEEFSSHATESGHWDWNCDGIQERQYTSVGYCSRCCWINVRDEEDIPGCGERGTFRTCCGSTNCPDDSDFAQPCR